MLPDLRDESHQNTQPEHRHDQQKKIAVPAMPGREARSRGCRQAGVYGGPVHQWFPDLCVVLIEIEADRTVSDYGHQFIPQCRIRTRPAVLRRMSPWGEAPSYDPAPAYLIPRGETR